MGDIAVPVLADGGHNVGHAGFTGVLQQFLQVGVMPVLPFSLQNDGPVANGAQPDVAVVGEKVL